jgi:hypothetical protein
MCTAIARHGHSSYNNFELADVTEYDVFQGHADIGTELVNATEFMSVSEVPTFMLASESRILSQGENSDALVSEAMKAKRFQLPET